MLISYKPEDLALAHSIIPDFRCSIFAEEWAGLYRFTIDNKLANIVEIGSYWHISSMAFLMALKHLGGGTLTCIDIHFPNPSFKFEDPNVKLIKIENSSDIILPTLKKEYDLSFIDGGHGSRQVTSDIKKSLKVVKKGGYLIMHDVNYTPTYRAVKWVLGELPKINLSNKKSNFHGVSIFCNNT